MRWPLGHASSPLPRTLLHPQGAASPCRRTGDAAAAPVESVVKPAQSGSRWPSPLGPEGLYEDQGVPACKESGIPLDVRRLLTLHVPAVWVSCDRGEIGHATLAAIMSLLSKRAGARG